MERAVHTSRDVASSFRLNLSTSHSCSHSSPRPITALSRDTWMFSPLQQPYHLSSIHNTGKTRELLSGTVECRIPRLRVRQVNSDLQIPRVLNWQIHKRVIDHLNRSLGPSSSKSTPLTLATSHHHRRYPTRRDSLHLASHPPPAETPTHTAWRPSIHPSTAHQPDIPPFPLSPSPA